MQNQGVYKDRCALLTILRSQAAADHCGIADQEFQDADFREDVDGKNYNHRRR